MNRKKLLFIIIFSFIIFCFIIKNNNMSGFYWGKVEIIEKEYITDSNIYYIKVDIPDLDTESIIFEFNPAKEFEYSEYGISKKVTIDEVWNEIELEEYMMYIKINGYPMKFFHEFELKRLHPMHY